MVCEPRDDPGCTLPTNSSRFNFVITRLDPDLVHARLTFSHTYAHPGVYTAYFEGCCRSRRLHNNAGEAFHLRTSVSVLGSSTGISPRLALPALLHLKRADSYLIAAIGAPGSLQVAYRAGDLDEMGFGMDRALQLAWSDGNSHPFESPDGVTISSDGKLSLAAVGGEGCSTGCLLQVSLIAYDHNASTAVDLVIEVVAGDGPDGPDDVGVLATPPTSRSVPAVILCNSSDFTPPENSTYLVSDCIDLAEMHDFHCPSLVGICPSKDYAFVHPYNSPLYANCFTQAACASGKHRAFCTDLTRQGHTTDFLRLMFRPAAGSSIRYIRQVNEFPTGVEIQGACGQHMAAGTCEGTEMAVGRPEMNKYLDLKWRPSCADPSQLGLWGLCFVAEGSNGIKSKPACLYISVISGLATLAPQLGYQTAVIPDFYPFTYPAPPAPVFVPEGAVKKMVIYRQPAHIIAGEAFMVQPQVAFLDGMGRLLSELTLSTPTVQVAVSPVGMHPEVLLGGNLMARVVHGVATFTDLMLPREGVGYMLRITADAVSDSTAFQIDTLRFYVLPEALKLKLTVPPRDSISGEPLPGPPTVLLMDFDWNFAVLSGKTVRVSLTTVSTVPNDVGVVPTLYGLTTEQAAHGVGKFDDLKITVAGDYRLVFSLERVGPILYGSPLEGWMESPTFSVRAGKAAILFVQQQPCALPCLDTSNMHQVADDLFTCSLAMRDSYYNLVFFDGGDAPANAPASVSLRRYPDKPNVESLLGGDLSVAASPQEQGVFGYTFTNLFIKEQGFFSIVFEVQSDYTISNTSLVFDVQLAVDSLDVRVPPTTSTAGDHVQGPPTLALLDAYRFGTASKRISWTELNSSAAVFSCAAPCHNAAACVNKSVPYNDTCRQAAVIVSGVYSTPVAGVATFAQVVVRRAAVNYRLTVYAKNDIFTATPFFTVEHSEPYELTVSRLPMKMIMSEPFGVQPLVALTDSFGNICLKESSRVVEAALVDASGTNFFLAGVPKIRLQRGVADFHNLAIEAYSLVTTQTLHTLRFRCHLSIAGSLTTLQTVTQQLEVDPGVVDLSMSVQPSASVAGSSVVGAPAVQLTTANSSETLVLSNRTISARVVEANCPLRYPVPEPVVPRIVQVEMRGAVPLVAGQAFVITNFRAVGFAADGGRASVKIIDAHFQCEENRSGVDASVGADEQPLTCFAEGNCVAAEDDTSLYLSFTLVRVPASGQVRVCAKADGENNAVVSVAPQQLRTWKLWTTLPLVEHVAIARLAAHRAEPIDQVTLWWAGPDFDACAAFRTATSDSRIAFVLSRDVVWNASHAYSCPRHPVTEQVYRWASSEEVLALGTLFTDAAHASSIYGHQCGSSATSKEAFMFSDFATVELYAKGGSLESDALADGVPSADNVAGLVCMSDEVLLECTSKCHHDRCPVPDAQPGHVDEDQHIVARWTQHREAHPENSSVTVSPDMTFGLRSDMTGNSIALTSGSYVTLHLSLKREPASWVMLVPNESPHPEWVTWPAGARLSQNTWGDGVRHIFGGKGPGWNYSRHEAFDEVEWDQEVAHSIECGPQCSAWPINSTVELVYTLYSSVPSYNGTTLVILLRKAPETGAIAAELMGPSIIYTPPPLRSPAAPPPAVQPPVLDDPVLDFCIRAGAHWRIGGDKEGTHLCQHQPAYKCGITWCGERVKQIDSGGYHSCAVDQDDKLVCWGRNSTGQAGPPWNVRSSRVLSVDTGTYHTCAVLEDESITCWGDNLRGQTNVPSSVSSWKAVTCGTAHSCGIDAMESRGYCWGDATYGQTAVPAEATDLVSISAGFFHTCAVAASGRGYCWGSTQYDYKQTVLPVSGPWKQISAGNLHSCGVLVNGTALCWGLGDSGQTKVPAVAAGVTWAHVSAGLLHSCGVTSTGHALCWGSEALNRLLVKPKAEGPWVTVSAGYEHSCGLLKTGRIACWGSPSEGRLAVSAAQFVSYNPPCESAPSDLEGHHACNAAAGPFLSSVDVSMSVRTPSAHIYYTVASDTTDAMVATPLLYSSSFRFDVSATVTATARSLDDQVADGDSFSYEFVLRVGVPNITVVPPSLSGAACAPAYCTSVEVLIAGDASMNPFASTSFYFTTNGTDAETFGQVYTRAAWITESVNGSNVSTYQNALILGNTTADFSGITEIKVVARRPGALDSQVASRVLATQVAPLSFTPNNLSAQVTDADGVEVSISTTTPDTAIYYTICIPSRCQVPAEPTENATRYTGPLIVNETGTVVRAIGLKGNLVSSAVSERTYHLQLEPPALSPPPNAALGYIAPVGLIMTCGRGGTPHYTLNSSEPYQEYTSIVPLERNVTVRAICVRRMRAGMLLDSVVTQGHYDITIFQILDAPVTESTQLVHAENRITARIMTTLAITQGTTITISGLTGSRTEDDANMPLSLPGLEGQWTQASGTLVATVTAPPTTAERVFAVTDSLHCAESLPLTSIDFTTCNPASGCNAQLSSRHLDVVHGGWEQAFYVNDVLTLTIKYFFQERCTLRDRLWGSPDPHHAGCDVVRWRVQYHGTSDHVSSPPSLLTGFYRFSSTARAGSKFASDDDGAWGAADAQDVVANGPRPQGFWGQGVFDSADSELDQCNSLYLGDADNPILSDSLRSVVKLTDVDATLVFSFVLVNPTEDQAPVTPQIEMSGDYCDALSPPCVTQHLGPQAMQAGAGVLGAGLAVGLTDAHVAQDTLTAGATSVISLALKTNVQLSPELCLSGCVLQISQLPGYPHSAPVHVGRTSVPETVAVSFECSGYRSCSVSAENYLPPGAVFVSADLDVYITCTDFNSADEIIETLAVGGINVDDGSMDRGPWAGCEASCEAERQVVHGLDVSSFAAAAVPVYLAASLSVDHYSCSETTTSFVRARVVVNVQFYYTGSYVAGNSDADGVVSYALSPFNLDPNCDDGAYSVNGHGADADEWHDSGGYTCRDYEAFQWCNAGGHCGGDQWTCEDFAVNEESAKTVCCTCGGGQRWWTRVSFEIVNSASAGGRAPHVAIVRSDGYVLVNETLQAHMLGDSDGLAARSSQSHPSSLHTTALAGPKAMRRLLQSQSQCNVSSTMEFSWASDQMELYTCCWDEFKRQVAKAVAETVLTQTVNVDVTLSSKLDTNVTAWISVTEDSQEICIAIANNLRPNLVARALASQRLHVQARFADSLAVSMSASPVVYSSSGAVLSTMTVVDSGYDSVGDWYEANFAGFRDATEVSYVQQWETGRVLTGNHSVLSLAGMAAFQRVVINKACSQYQLQVSTLVSDTLLHATSDAFSVRAGTPAQLYVSPVPTMFTDRARWPCWSPEACNGTTLVAGMYFAVTATVVDALNNTCLDAAGAVTVSASVLDGETDAVVYGDNGESMRNGTRVLKLRIEQALQNTSNPAMLVFTYMPQLLDWQSGVFMVRAAPLAVLVLQDTVALASSVYAGDVLAPALELLLRDAYGNAVLEYLEVEAELLNAPDALLGTTTEMAREARVVFSLLSIQRAAANYSMVFHCDGVVNVTASFDVLHAHAGRSDGDSFLTVDRLPANAVSGEALTVQPKLQLMDRYGNLATRHVGNVQVSAFHADGAGFSEVIAGTTAASLVDGTATFSDLVIMSSGSLVMHFALGSSVGVNTSIDVGPSLAKLNILQQPTSVMVQTCADPYPSVELLSANDEAVNNSRKDISIDIAVNVFRLTNPMSCGSGGCFASTSFRYFIPQDAELINAFLDVDVAKTDFDEDEEYVEYILINGAQWPGANGVDGTCDPGAADMCFSYHKCVRNFDVTDRAKENYLTVTVKISAAVNDFCAPRLQARVQLYGSYRPLFPETTTMVQNGDRRPLGGLTTLKASGRTLVFKDLFFQVPGYGYRLRLYADGGAVSVETEPFNVWETVSKAEFKVQPGLAMAGEKLRRQPVLEFLDQFNNLVTSYEALVTVAIDMAQIWDQTLNSGFGGWRDLAGADAPVLSGTLESVAQSGGVQFVDLALDRQVERITLSFRACIIGPSGLPDNSACIEKTSYAFAVAQAVQFLTVEDLASSVKAGRMTSAKILLFNGPQESGKSPSTSTVVVSAVNNATGLNTVEGTVAVAAVDGEAHFDSFYFRDVGDFTVTFKVQRGGVLQASVQQSIVVEAGDPVAIAVLDNGLNVNFLQVGQPFVVQLEMLDKFGNRNLAPSLSVIARPAPGSDYQLFSGTSSEPRNEIHNMTGDGIVSFHLRVDSAQQVSVDFAVALSPAQSCTVDEIGSEGCSDPRGPQYCAQADVLVDGPAACLARALCSYIPTSQSCVHSCECAGGGGGGRARESVCSPCVATTSLLLTLYASESSGEVRLSMLQQPGSAVDGSPMGVQPKVLVEVCTGISSECNRLANVSVMVALESAEDEYTRVDKPSRTNLVCAGSCLAMSDYDGVATFSGLLVDSPGSGGASLVVLNFTVGSHASAHVSADPFDLSAEENVAPEFVDPTPVLCEDDDAPMVFYAGVGTRLHLVLNASDSNIAPYDDVTIDVDCIRIAAPGSSGCDAVLPPDSYLTENMYPWASHTLKPYIPECELDRPLTAQSEPKTKLTRQQNRVERHFIWSPVKWFPAFALTYAAVEATREQHAVEQATCTRTVQIVVCDRPKFVAPSPIDDCSHLMALAGTEIVFTVAALDRNPDDVVEIATVDAPDLDHMSLVVGPNVHDERLLVTGLEKTSRNRVSRRVHWAVPNDGNTHTVCFRARDNQFPCSDGGLESEEKFCVHCSLDSLGVYTTCSSTLMVEKLDDRLPPIVCGDDRMTDIEECDDGNVVGGDGCSPLCQLEEGYYRGDQDLSPKPKYKCGDGLVVIGETCDDNNTVAGDGCDSICQTEAGFTCLECAGLTECLPTCGDGILKSNHLRTEECDGVEGCSWECSIEEGWSGTDNVLYPICGDGLLRGGEECDDFNTVSGDGCSDTCEIEDNWNCGAAGCQAICGDGVRTGLEQCDDGNLVAGDGCDPACHIEEFFFCPFGDLNNGTRLPDVCEEICGDGERVQSNSSRVRPGFDRINACDDGNLDDYDGCSADCEIEADLGWECADDMSALGTSSSPRSVCGPRCGDGMRTDAEECDDGNLLNKDGCSSTCKIETGFVCALGTAGAQAQMLMESSSCINTLESNGTCCFSDGGNLSFGALCSPTTQPGDAGAYCLSKSDLCWSSVCEPTVGKSQEICYLIFTGRASPVSVLMNMDNVSYLERGVADVCSSSCGDGHRALQEECDDANLVSGDGCSSDCKIEGGWYCLHQPGPQGDFCSSICGDAVLVPGVEECDDGAWTEASGDGCTSLCKLEIGFNCSYDEKNRLYGGRCNPICGDGWWVLGEGCDDHNADSMDGCSSGCVVEPGWVCGADTSKPEMRTSVCVGVCGDGIKVSGEECDDNNILNGDGCSDACEIEPGFACLDSGECYTVCGDGVVIGKESCDDGNDVNGDGCTNDCVIEHGYQCIQAVCSGSDCQVQAGGLGSYCQECPPVRQTAVRCSNPPCPVVGLTADCEQWFFTGDGAWVRKEDLPASSFSMRCKPEWYGDGFCDAINNREGCEYDKGDCCQRSCACGGANTNPCYNGIMGGCGKFVGKKGDYRCVQSVSETGENLAADLAIVHLSGGSNLGTDMYGPYLSSVLVEIVPPGPGIEVYISTDGKPPAEETATHLLIHGTPYVEPLNVTANQVVRVSTVKWGLAVGQVSLPLKIQVEKPTISPSPGADEVLLSPVRVSISTKTPGATIKYQVLGGLTGSDEHFVYDGPFAIDSGGTVTAWAEKEDAVSSEKTSASYNLQTTTPTISPPAGRYVRELAVNVSTGTALANVYVTVCNGTKYPGWSNRTIGEIRQTAFDVFCFPDCKGACVGGFNDKKACASETDLTTCSGGGTCVTSFHEVRECFPNEWPPGRVIWSAPIIVNQTTYGSGAWVTSYATREGMADSNLTSHQYHLTTDMPAIQLLPQVHPPLPWPYGNVPEIVFPLVEHGQEEGPYVSPLMFNFSNPTPADVYYTLDNSTPKPGEPGTFKVPYAEIQAPVPLNRTANITWIAVAENLEPSMEQRRSVAVQAATPELLIHVRYFDMADGLATLWEWSRPTVAIETPSDQTKPGKGLVSQGFAYPGIGKVQGTTKNLFADYPPDYPSGFPYASMRPITQDAQMYYRLVNGSLSGWPKTAVRPGSSEPDSLQELSAKGWVRFDGAEIEIRENVTMEVMAAVPGSTLIKSDIKSYPLFVREKCENGQASVDGYGPCALCPLDTYTICEGDACTCVDCKTVGNDTGTYQAGSSGASACKAFCPVGTFSPLGGVDVNGTNCTKCGLGSYSDATRSSACTACPTGTSTWRYGAEDISQCRGAGGLVAGGFHSCGVDVGGGAKCWGYNAFNQTNVPKKNVQWEENGVAYAEARDDTWYAVAAGSFHSCGITTEMKAKCWGQDFAGKTAVPTMHLYHSPEMPLREVNEWQSLSASAGYHHTCGIADGRALCWGDNEYEQINVPAGRFWNSISAGQFHSCGIDSQGEALCWGDNSYGQSEVPAEETTWRNVSAGHYHSCGVTAVGKLRCWGSTLYEATSFPQEVDAWASVAVGRFHSCGVTADGKMRCWGSNQDGAVSVPDGISAWRAVTAGLFHTCGITQDRTGICWGRSIYGLTILPDAAWSSV